MKQTMRNRKVLVLGANGMLGHMVFSYFMNNTECQTLGLTKESLNATWSYDDIKKTLLQYNPDFVINCIGLIHSYTKDTVKAFQVNSAFPHMLKQMSKEMAFKLVHISTDCVFDNTIYGKSKLAGEIDDEKNLTIRTSIIGPEINPNGTGLFNWFMSPDVLAVNGYKNVYWDGITTLELAKVIEKMLKDKEVGLIDYRNKEIVSKYSLLNIMKNVFKKKTIIKEDDSIVSNKTVRSSYRCEKSYYQQLIELRNYMEDFPTIYKRYFK